jgi:hypothetical protein
MSWKDIIKYDESTIDQVFMFVANQMGRSYADKLLENATPDNIDLIINEEINEMNANMRTLNLDKNDQYYKRMMTYINGLKAMFG